MTAIAGLDPASLAVAFAAGLVSLLSPCVLALVPAYLGYLSGEGLAAAPSSRLLGRAGLFVLGFSVFFVALGATATALGRMLWVHQALIRRLGGVLVVLLGLHQLGVLRFGWLEQERRAFSLLPASGAWRNSPWGAVAVGMAFAAGWSPCVGPVLASILMMAGTAETLGAGTALLAAYAAGMGLPFLAMATLVARGARRLAPRLLRHGVWVQRASGALLVLLGLMLYTNFFLHLPGYFNYYRSLPL